MSALPKILKSLSALILTILFGFSTLHISAQEATIGSIHIPSIDVNSSMVTAPLGERTWDVNHLRMNVGHLQHTAEPGQLGNTVIVGHSVNPASNPDIFYNLNHVPIGEIITVVFHENTYRYTVIEQHVVDYTDTSVVFSKGDYRLTLITCDPSSYNGAGFYQRRIVVVAIQIQ